MGTSNVIKINKMITFDEICKVLFIEIGTSEAFGDFTFGFLELPTNRRELNVDRKQFKKIYEFIHHKKYGQTFYGLFLFDEALIRYWNKYADQRTKYDTYVIKRLVKMGLVKQLASGNVGYSDFFDVIIINKELCKQKKLIMRNLMIHELSHFLYFMDVSFAKAVNKLYKSLNRNYLNLALEYLLVTKSYCKEEVIYEWAAYAIDKDKFMASLIDKSNMTAREKYDLKISLTALRDYVNKSLKQSKTIKLTKEN